MKIGKDDPRPSRTEKRWFGCVLLLAFSILGSLIGWRTGSHRATQASIGIGLALAVLYYTIAPLQVPLYRAWVALTMPLGRLLSTTALAAIFFLALTPMAWIMRVYGRDHLGRKFDPTAGTYWTSYHPGGDEDRYLRQS